VIGGQGDEARADPASARFRAPFGWSRITALVLAVLLLAGIGYGLITGQLSAVQGNATVFGQGSVEAIGGALYGDYLLPFELTSVLLLVGMIGAVVLARHE